MTSVTVTTGQWPAREFRIGGHGRVIINYVPTLHLNVYHLSIVPVAHISDDKFSRQRAHTNYLLRLRGLTRHVQIYIIYTKKKKFKKTIYPLSSPLLLRTPLTTLQPVPNITAAHVDFY